MTRHNPQPDRGLMLSAAVIGGFGALMLLATLPPVSMAFGLLADLVYWPLDGAQGVGDPGTRLMLAIGGGMGLAWGALILALAQGLAGADPAALRRVVVRSIWVWFVADSLFSAVVGAWGNVPGNVAFLALALWPLRAVPQAATAS